MSSDLDEIDIEVEVYPQPHHDKLRDIVVEILRSVGKPLRLLELWNALHDREYYVSDQRLKNVLREMIADGILMEFPDGTVGFPEWSKWYIPRSDVKRVRPITPHKFSKLYRNYASKIRRMGLPVAEVLNIIGDLNSVTQGEEASLKRKRFLGSELGWT
jgi:hypothetical protein